MENRSILLNQLSIREIREILQEEIQKAFIKIDTNNLTGTKQKSIFNFEEACQYIGISKSHGYKLTSQGLIPHYKRGKRLYFEKNELDKWLLANKVKDQSTIEAETNEYLSKQRFSNKNKGIS